MVGTKFHDQDFKKKVYLGTTFGRLQKIVFFF